MRVVQTHCPAKVNLFLEVTGRRRDGYHKLASLFAKINLFDVLDFAIVEKRGFTLEIVHEGGQSLGAGKDNLVMRAAAAFKKEFRVGVGVHIKLTKRIPIGAGLGGGSSDAAGTLLGMARLFKLPLNRSTKAKLRRLAAGLGADVPFFVHEAALADGRGIGERLKAVATPKTLPWMILVFPGEGVSTKEVFASLELPRRSAVLTSLSHLNKLKNKLEKGRPISDWSGLLFNRLEEPVFKMHSEIRQAKTILSRLGLRGVLMSGSGASVFGFVSSREEGELVEKRLSGYPWRVFLTCCLG